MVNPNYPTMYEGVEFAFAPCYRVPRDPTTNDIYCPEGKTYYKLPSFWVNKITNALWVCVGVTKIAADWRLITTGAVGAVDSFLVDANTPPGTNPVLADAAGQVTITGGQFANASYPSVMRINSLAVNAFTVQVQQAATSAATDATKNGVSHFNSTHFTMGADAFVSSQIATTAQIGIVTLASQVQSQYNTYGTTQVLQSGNISAMFASPAPIGSTAPNTGQFTTLQASSNALPTGQITNINGAISSTNTPLQVNLRCTAPTTAGFGCTLGLYADNSVNTLVDQTNFSGVWDVSTSGAEVAHAFISVRSGGAQTIAANIYADRLQLGATTSRFRIGNGGVDFMSGAGDPNGAVTAAQGSLYMRTDGSSTSTRAYINTDGATAWTSITTAT